LIVEAIDRYLERKKFSFVRYFVDEMLRCKADTAYCGVLFDILIAWTVRGAAKQGLNFLKEIPWTSVVGSEKKISVHTHLLPFLQGNHQVVKCNFI